MKVTSKGAVVPSHLIRVQMPPQGPLSKADYKEGTVNGMTALVGRRWWVPLYGDTPVEGLTHWMDLQDQFTGSVRPFSFCSYLPSDKIALSIPSRAGRGDC